jgi:hypothetical protein
MKGSGSVAGQFLQFMNNSLDGRASSMVSFLSKRARLMISFSIELLGEYLKILNRPGIEDSIDVNEFLDDISANLENFKLKEREIKEKHFNYSEESEIIDSQMVHSEMFSPDDISQLHAVRIRNPDSQSIL